MDASTIVAPVPRERFDLIARVSAAAALAVVLIAALLVRDYMARETQVQQDIRSEAKTASGYLQEFIRGQLNGLEVIANSGLVRGKDLPGITDYFIRLKNSGAVIGSLGYVDTHGVVRASNTGVTGTSVADREYVKEALAGRTTVGTPVVSRISGYPIVPLGVPVIINGRVEAVVLVGLALNDPKIFEPVLSFARGDLVVRSGDHSVIYDGGAITSLKDTSGMATTDELSATELVNGSPGWTVTAQVSASRALADARGNLTRGLILLLAALVILLLVFWSTRRRIKNVEAQELQARESESIALTELQQRKDAAEFLAACAIAIERHRGFGARATALLTKLVPQFADFATIESSAEDGPTNVIARHRDPELTDALLELRRDHSLPGDPHDRIHHVARTGEPFIEQMDPANYAGYAQGRVVELLCILEPESTMGVPLRSLGKTTASLFVGRQHGNPAFREEDLEQLQSLAIMAGLALETGALHDLDRSRLGKVQESLLPTTLPVCSDYEVTAYYYPAEQDGAVGGDWFDAFPQGDHLVVTIGDVVGHGFEAAATMGKLRHALRALSLTGLHPSEMLERADELTSQVSDGACTTAIVGVLHTPTLRFTYSSAGHLPIIHYSDGVSRMLEGTADLPVGVEKRARHNRTVQLQRGDHVLLYTDGLVETRTASLDDRLDRLTRGFQELVPSAGSSQQLLRDIRKSLATDYSRDDTCMLVVNIPM